MKVEPCILHGALHPPLVVMMTIGDIDMGDIGEMATMVKMVKIEPCILHGSLHPPLVQAGIINFDAPSYVLAHLPSIVILIFDQLFHTQSNYVFLTSLIDIAKHPQTKVISTQ